MLFHDLKLYINKSPWLKWSWYFYSRNITSHENKQTLSIFLRSHTSFRFFINAWLIIFFSNVIIKCSHRFSFSGVDFDRTFVQKMQLCCYNIYRVFSPIDGVTGSWTQCSRNFGKLLFEPKNLPCRWRRSRRRFNLHSKLRPPSIWRHWYCIHSINIVWVLPFIWPMIFLIQNYQSKYSWWVLRSRDMIWNVLIIFIWWCQWKRS